MLVVWEPDGEGLKTSQEIFSLSVPLSLDITPIIDRNQIRKRYYSTGEVMVMLCVETTLNLDASPKENAVFIASC